MRSVADEAPSRVTSPTHLWSYQPRVAVLVFDDPAFPTLQRVEGQVDVVGCEASEPGGPHDKDVVGAGREPDELWIGGNSKVHLPADLFSHGSSAGIKQGDIVS
jgi:hypothetical protein